MDDASDADLVSRIASNTGRTSAEAALCHRYVPRIHLYGVKHLRDADLARDLTQTVLVAVLQAARDNRIDDPPHLDRFVFGTCRNTVSRMRLTAARVPLASETAVAELAINPEPIELKALYTCLFALESRAKQILMMSFLEERSADEIATTLSTNAGHIRVIRHRALAALRQCLDTGSEHTS